MKLVINIVKLVKKNIVHFEDEIDDKIFKKNLVEFEEEFTKNLRKKRYPYPSYAQ